MTQTKTDDQIMLSVEGNEPISLADLIKVNDDGVFGLIESEIADLRRLSSGDEMFIGVSSIV